LVPNAAISLQGTGANRTVTITPGASQSGNTTITIMVDDGTDQTSVSFVLTVNPINDSPTITPIANQTTAENTPTEPIPFTIGDAETPATDLIVSATSSNTTIVPTGGITFDGTGSARTVTITPATGQSGIVTITIFVSDQSAAPVSTAFTLTVSSSEDPPTITAIGAQTINEDTSTPALPFTIGDPDTPLADLEVTATSSNKTLIPDANVELFGTGISRTVTVTPASNQTGVSTITLSVTDGTATVSTTFQVTVNEANDAPTISPVGPQTTSENTATPAIPFKVTDLETVATALTVTASSSNVALVPNAAANLTLAGSGEDRTLVVTPAAGQSGDATITLTVSDGTATASTTFTVTVTSVNDPPTITAIQPQTTNEDTPTSAIAFTLADAETAVGSLTVSGTSSDTQLVPDANIVISGSGAAKSVVITPTQDKNGSTTITLTVTDSNGGSAQTTFTLTVTPVNDPPTITAQLPLTTLENTSLALTPGHFTIVDPDNGTNDYSIIIVKSTGYSASENVVTPLPDFFGDLEVTVKVSDGKLTSADFVATISVTDVNIAPTIIGQSPNPLELQVNTSVTLDATNILVEDPDSDNLTEISFVVSEGNNYTLSGPNLTTITPLPDYKGPLEVSVRASDGKAMSQPFIVKINVFAPSEQPVITGQVPLVIEEDNTLTLKLEDLIVSDNDDPDYPVGFTLLIEPGELYSVNDNQITPALNENGFITVTVRVNDGQNPSKPFELRIYVTPVNDAPEITVLESLPILYEPGTGPVPITQTFEFEDVDSDHMAFAEVGLIDAEYKPANDELIFEASDASTIRGVYDPARGVLSLIGYATKDDYIAAIRSVQYNYRLTLDVNGEQSEISTAPKKYYINLNDGQASSENKERAIELETSVELDIPNAFTPNGDETNNTWAVKPVTKTDQFDETVIRVYNKRGLMVYEARGLDSPWDGTYQGETLPVDTYYYTIDLKLSFIRKTFKGSVTILR
jgi:gliding motility-associated-like protein